MILPVSAPFHSSLMRPAANRLREYLASVAMAAPRIAVINNVDVADESEPSRIVDALARQAAGAVRWVEIVQLLARLGVTHVLECGPGRVLAGLTRRIEPALESHAVYDADSLAATLEILAHSGKGA
jgi:[acyl-carrier-protein] S-malonyltransferase